LEDSGPAGRERVRLHLEKLLARPGFIEERLGPNPPAGRHIIHHDPETDMYVLAHIYETGGESSPHDHGPHWVIYGNATGYTDMTEWRRLDDGKREGYAELESQKPYRVESGMAVVFDVGKIHSIRYPNGTRFVRVTGGDVESGKNLRFDVKSKKVMVQDRAKENRIASRPTG